MDGLRVAHCFKMNVVRQWNHKNAMIFEKKVQLCIGCACLAFRELALDTSLELKLEKLVGVRSLY